MGKYSCSLGHTHSRREAAQRCKVATLKFKQNGYARPRHDALANRDPEHVSGFHKDGLALPVETNSRPFDGWRPEFHKNGENQEHELRSEAESSLMAGLPTVTNFPTLEQSAAFADKLQEEPSDGLQDLT